VTCLLIPHKTNKTCKQEGHIRGQELSVQPPNDYIGHLFVNGQLLGTTLIKRNDPCCDVDSFLYMDRAKQTRFHHYYNFFQYKRCSNEKIMICGYHKVLHQRWLAGRPYFKEGLERKCSSPIRFSILKTTPFRW
jgi:hypothetical protein